MYYGDVITYQYPIFNVGLATMLISQASKDCNVCENSYTYLHTSERKAANNVNLALIMNEYSDAALVSLAPTFRLRWTVGTDYQQKQQQNNQTPALLTLCE